jgi:hypothetical protein
MVLSLSDVHLSRSSLAAAGIVRTLLQPPPADGGTCGNTMLTSPRCKPRRRHADRSCRLPCMPDVGFQGNRSRFVTVGSSSEPVGVQIVPMHSLLGISKCQHMMPSAPSTPLP